MLFSIDLYILTDKGPLADWNVFFNFQVFFFILMSGNPHFSSLYFISLLSSPYHPSSSSHIYILLWHASSIIHSCACNFILILPSIDSHGSIIHWYSKWRTARLHSTRRHDMSSWSQGSVLHQIASTFAKQTYSMEI